MLNSFTKRSPQQNANFNDTRNNISILPPEITSTPLISPSRNKMVTPIITPTRRMLGSKKYSLSSNGLMSPLRAVKNPPGPLLASTSYNVNVGTYIDTKSPGYTARLVQYNEDNSRRQQYTHQEKYDSPGCLPIVHLYKKDLPVISPKPRKPTIRIGAPEHRSPYSQEHSRLLLESIVKNNSTPKEQDHSSDSTRSVLDALKEISRKRIHSSREYETMDETNKKLKRDCVITDGESSKRNRMDSPSSDSGSPPTRQPTKRICTIDAVLASKTSSMGEDFRSFNKKKTVNEPETTPTGDKKRFNNAETQTAEASNSKQQKKLVEEYIVEAQKENKKIGATFKIITVDEKPIPPPQPTLKVFDDKPLEVIRKNRLGALLSALTGREIPQIPMVDRRKALEESWTPRDSKKLVSILSTQKKETKSAEKHVSFTINKDSSTESNNQTEKSTETEKCTEEVSSTSALLPETPKSSTIASDSNSSKFEDKVNKEATSSSITEVSADKNTPVSPLGGFKFDSVESTPPTSTSAPIGGFKFDLNKPTTVDKNVSDNKSSAPLNSIVNASASESTMKTVNVDVSSTSMVSASVSLPSFLTNLPKPSSKSDNSPVSSKSSFEIKSLGNNSATSVTNSLGFAFSLPETKNVFGATTTTPFAFGTNQKATSTTTASSQEKTTPLFPFGKSEMPKTSVSVTTSTSNLTATTTSGTTPMVSFGIPKSAATILPTKSPKGNSGSKITSSSNLANVSLPSSTGFLGSPASSFAVAATAASSSFGKSSTPNFANPPSKNLFPTATPFGTVSSSLTTSAPSFGTTTTTSAVASTSSTGFNFSAQNSLPAFVSSSTTPAFGQVSNTPSSFAVNSLLSTSSANNAFGNSTATTTTAAFATAFGNSTNTNTNAMFGTTTTASFGSTSSNNNSFGSNTKPFTFGSNNNQAFNGPATTANSSSMFIMKNSQSQMTLGTNTTASTSSNIPFGSTPPAFGTPNNNPMFPATNNNSFGKTTTVPSFGTTTTPSFGATTTASTFGPSNPSSFGTSNSSIPAFGKPNTPNFGVASTTTSSMFGTTNTPTFGTANTTSSNFGTSATLNFGTPSTAAPAFGTNSTAFGSTTTPSLFGPTNQTFGNSTTASGFGTTNTPSFGTSNNNFSSSFGPSSAAPFGTATTTAANTFNSISAPFGGSSGTNAFGSTTSPFNPTTTASGFGASSSGNFGNSNPTAFGNSGVANNAFGSTNGPFGGTTAPNSFGSNMAPTNGFNSGFGSSASKPDPSNIFSSQGTNMFGNSSGFGSSQNGNLASGTASTNGVFTFGSPNAQSSSTTGVFAFGAAEPPKTFNFTTPGQTGNGGGGFPTAPSFGPSNASVPSMFSIGSGSSSTSSQNRSGRPFARGKRRT